MTAQMKADKRQIMELEEENAIPKSSAHLHASTEMKYGFIHANSTEFRVTMICEVLKMSGSGYYAWGKRGPSLRSAKDEILVDGFERSTR